MRFERLAPREAEGAILAHTVRWRDGALRKGVRIDAAAVRRLEEAGVGEVVAAVEEPGDLAENAAAERLAGALLQAPVRQGLRLAPASTGRCNIFADRPGVLRVLRGEVDRLNALDEAISLATLSDLVRVGRGQLVATVKIIPYAVPESLVASAERMAVAGPDVLEVRGAAVASAALLLTRLPWTPDSLGEKLGRKGERAVRRRLEELGVPLVETRTVPHAEEPLAEAIAASEAEMVLVLGDSATSDRNDVAPAALRAAGGKIERFGMPVDPGNLLLLGTLGERPVLVFPGCVRSPKLNGADWVLERVVCGIPVTSQDIAGMGVGGLLQEIPLRPAPRVGDGVRSGAPKVAVLLLAAGTSRRMEGEHKLLRPLEGTPLVARAALRLEGAGDLVLVTGHRGEEIERAVRDAGARPAAVVRNEAYDEGIGASIRTGMSAVDAEADAVVVALADMPGIDRVIVERLVAAYDPDSGRAICRAVAPGSAAGHPVLFGRRFFEALSALTGDRGARDLLVENAHLVANLETTAREATDLDTVEDWRRWSEGENDGGE